ncbi:phosphoenolpyruvate--protein phosphotransferase [Reinekea sp.]|jgi:phosphoenolpyruvate-protein phosphotransferase|uniref:phosphoenolpyruvate--protein phosphotransferase n=1 Tax=Reinekea sp. TaxID=1970455 RepID=UPI003988DAA4
MLELKSSDIRLDAEAADKSVAISLIVADMVADGMVAPGYEAGMHVRETQTSTYLGNGIAIPHGTPETKDQVLKTGIKVLRFKQGIDWGDGQIVYTAIGIAAKSDEHLTILRQLTHVIVNDELSERLHKTEQVAEVLSILKGEQFEPTLHMDTHLIRTNVDVQYVTEAISLAASALFAQGLCSTQERDELINSEALDFGEGVWINTVKTTNLRPALAIVSSQATVQEASGPFNILLSLTSNGKVHKPLYDRLLQLQRDGKLSQLTTEKNADKLLRLLKMEALEGESIEIRLPIEQGLHARPASHLAKLIKQLNADIWVENLDGNDGAVLGTSVARLIGLGFSHGDLMRFTVTKSDDPQSALRQLSTAVSEGLGDEVKPIPVDHSPQVSSTVVEAPAQERVEYNEKISGLCGAPGLAIGTARVKIKQDFSYPENSENRPDESKRFQDALQQLNKTLKGSLAHETNEAKMQILTMHIELLDDPEFVEATQEFISSGKTAEWSWMASVEGIAASLEQHSEALLAERASDYRDLGYQLMMILTGQQEQSTEAQPHIVIADEINPSDVVKFDKNIVQAIVTAKGGVTSHAAILARAAGIPLLVGCGPVVLNIADGTPLVVDCDNRYFMAVESDSALNGLREEQKQRKAEYERAFEDRFLPATTVDGVNIEVVANISSSSQVEDSLGFGSEGVGLFRSEFLYMAHPQEPTHEQQVAEYKAALDAMATENQPLIVRTLDVGGDKPLPYLAMPQEENPFLGVRGARLSLLYPDMLKRQLRALFEAADRGLLRIMFPMLSDITEWRAIKEIYNEVAEEYPGIQLELGMMIEVPSAALMADVFAKELDFFSVGTNDLTQYTMAVDRGHPVLSKQADSLHPAILRLIKTTVDAAKRNDIWVGVCGELAADPLAAVILLGLGVRELSMSQTAIPQIKAKIRSIDSSQAKILATAALDAESTEAIRALDRTGVTA